MPDKDVLAFSAQYGAIACPVHPQPDDVCHVDIYVRREDLVIFRDRLTRAMQTVSEHPEAGDAEGLLGAFAELFKPENYPPKAQHAAMGCCCHDDGLPTGGMFGVN